MKALKAITLGSMTAAALLQLTSLYADPLRDSFDRDLNRVATAVRAAAIAPMDDALQQAVRAATWTRPEDQVLQSFLRDLHRAPTASAAARLHAEVDPMSVYFSILTRTQARDLLAQSRAR